MRQPFCTEKIAQLAAVLCGASWVLHGQRHDPGYHGSLEAVMINRGCGGRIDKWAVQTYWDAFGRGLAPTKMRHRGRTCRPAVPQVGRPQSRVVPAVLLAWERSLPRRMLHGDDVFGMEWNVSGPINASFVH